MNQVWDEMQRSEIGEVQKMLHSSQSRMFLVKIFQSNRTRSVELQITQNLCGEVLILITNPTRNCPSDKQTNRQTSKQANKPARVPRRQAFSNFQTHI